MIKIRCGNFFTRIMYIEYNFRKFGSIHCEKNIFKMCKFPGRAGDQLVTKTFIDLDYK